MESELSTTQAVFLALGVSLAITTMGFVTAKALRWMWKRFTGN